VFILGLGTPFALAERLGAGRPDQALAALAPLALVLLFGWLSAPSPLTVAKEGITVSRSRAARLRGAKTRFAWAEVADIYPSFYEDAGMKFSPFASAEGTAKHAGIRIETVGGEKVVMAFTPTVLDLRKHGTAPYHAAMDAIREACAALGRPLVQHPPALSPEKVDEMLIESSRPLLPFPLTVAGIFAPGLLIPGIAVLASALGAPLTPAGTAAAVVVGLLPLLAVFALVNLRSGRRTELLHQVQKHREAVRERSSPGDGGGRPAPTVDHPSPAAAPQRVLRARGR
jgi:hypothetical protein